MKHFWILLVMCSFSVHAQKKLKKDDLENLKNRMCGSFNSELQSKQDSAFFNIHLHMTRIWPEQPDGYWLYVEQATASALNKPYRQRIYHVYQQDKKTLVSKVYEMNAPLRFAGGWQHPEIFGELLTDSLIDRLGCAIYLHKNKTGDFYGATPGKECLSTLRGANYATSEVVIKAEELISWDRGWNNADKQVWGAVKGGYHFVKIKE
ncbi:MAG: chromophore lyase CpcT/CpeT [Ferruginibacter sp.]